MCATHMDPPASTRGVTLRAATLDDIPGAVALINRESQRLRGRDDVDATAFRGWVSQLGVLRDYRRRGRATALLTHVFSTFQSCGLTRVGLGVDAESTTGAVRLHENAGMTVIERNDIWERRE